MGRLCGLGAAALVLLFMADETRCMDGSGTWSSTWSSGRGGFAEGGPYEKAGGKWHNKRGEISPTSPVPVRGLTESYTAGSSSCPMPDSSQRHDGGGWGERGESDGKWGSASTGSWTRIPDPEQLNKGKGVGSPKDKKKKKRKSSASSSSDDNAVEVASTVDTENQEKKTKLQKEKERKARRRAEAAASSASGTAAVASATTSAASASGAAPTPTPSPSPNPSPGSALADQGEGKGEGEGKGKGKGKGIGNDDAAGQPPRPSWKPGDDADIKRVTALRCSGESPTTRSCATGAMPSASDA